MRSCSLLISSLITLSLLSSREGESSTTNKYLVPNVTGVCPSPGACQGEFVHQQPSVLLLISVTCVKCGSGTCQWLKSPLIFQRLSRKAAWGCLIFQPLSWRKAGTALPNSNRKSGKMANGISRGNWGLCREWCSSRAQVSQSQHCCLSDILPAASYPNPTGVCLVSSSAFSLTLSSSGRGWKVTDNVINCLEMHHLCPKTLGCEQGYRWRWARRKVKTVAMRKDFERTRKAWLSPAW